MRRRQEVVSYCGYNPQWWGLPIVSLLGKPGWYVPVTSCDQADRIEKLTFHRLSAHEEAVHEWAFPYSWGYLRQRVVVGTLLERLHAQWLKRPSASKTVEFVIRYYDPMSKPRSATPEAIDQLDVINAGNLV